MKAKIWRVSGLIIAALFIAWAIYFVSTQENLRSVLEHLKWYHLALVVIAHFAFLFINGVFLWRIMVRFDVGLPFWESVHLSVLTTSFNSFLPLSSGITFRAIYLKKKFKFPVSKFVATTAGSYLLNYNIFFLAGFLSSAYVAFAGEKAAWPPTLFFLGGFLATFALLIFSKTNFYLPHFIHRRLKPALESWRTIAQDSRLVIDLTILSAANVAITAFMLFVSFWSVGEIMSPISSVLMSALESLSLFVKLTPGNLGIAEAFIMYGGSLVALPPARALLASAMLRISLYILLIFVTPLSLLFAFRRHWKSELKQMLHDENSLTHPSNS